MDTLKKIRANLKRQVTLLKASVDDYVNNAPALALTTAHLDKVRDLDTFLRSNWDDIAPECATEAEYESHAPYYEAELTRLESIKGTILMYRQANLPAPPNPPPAPINPHPTSVKLPAIELPTFSGRIEGWQGFSDMFRATIDSNPSLSKVEKLKYLKVCVKDDAAKLLQSLQITEANYDVAWQTLRGRFQNQREAVTTLLRRIMNQPSSQVDSATTLRTLIDTTRECCRSLEALHRNPNSDLLVVTILEKLDLETRKHWELSLKGTDMPTFKELIDFLESHAAALTSITLSKPKTSKPSNPRGQIEGGKARSHHSSTSSDGSKCPFCEGEHWPSRCDTYLKYTIDEKFAAVRKLKLCFNCLSSAHVIKDCPSSACRTCGGRHHTTLHQDKDPKPKLQSTSSQLSGELSPFLSTVLGFALDKYAKPFPCRIFLDGGSNSNFVSTAFVKKLQLYQRRAAFVVTGLGSKEVATTRSTVHMQIRPHFESKFTFNFDAFVISQVTDNLPSSHIDISKWKHLRGLNLADPTFNVPAPIDILLGAGAIGQLLLPRLRRGPVHLPIALQTKLGWAIFGGSHNRSFPCRSHHTQLTLNESVRKFWEIEELSNSKGHSNDESHCLSHFSATHSRDQDGRFTVELPLKDDIPLGNSKSIALRRFHSLERRLESNPHLKIQYSSFIQEYIDLGHMAPIQDSEKSLPASDCFYLPHHCVLKEDSLTTKLRVVFDGSSKSSSGYSLNDKLYVGPVVQPDLFSILLRFRRWPVSLTTDITKMYRQIRVHPKHVNFQRILWRFDKSTPVQEYNLVTVTYGTASAPFLATQSLVQLAADEEVDFPVASKALREDTYVDDIVTGSSTESAAISLVQELVTMTRKAGLKLNKWISNSKKVLDFIPSANRCSADSITLDLDDTVKTLGLRYLPGIDSFQFTVSPFNAKKLTKRVILSDIAKLFDPLGWLAPVVVMSKIFLQEMWKQNLSWDTELPSSLSSEWVKFRTDLPVLGDVTIPRCALSHNNIMLELHGFSDASEKAYAACVYLRSKSASGKFSSHLLCSKSRVSPLKTVSLPRLELCGAVLLAKLVNLVHSQFQLPISTVHCWCDSTITLDWISSPPHKWKVFVSNRVSEIQNSKIDIIWHHISGKFNPADLPSRGLMATEIVHNQVWWRGPAFLSCEDPLPAPYKQMDISTECLLEQKSPTLKTHYAKSELPSIIYRYSSFSRMKRITCWVKRFARSTLKQSCENGLLTVEELRDAGYCLISAVQCSVFQEEISALQNGDEVSNKSSLKKLHPYIDKNNVLRVGGRQSNASLPEEVKHPIILPSHHLTRTIIREAHLEHLHAGVQLLTSILQQQYWIISGRKSIRAIVRQCLPCVRELARTSHQLMGNLPSTRLTPSRAFSCCGCDYAGPIQFRPIKGRRSTSFKCWVVIFVCFCTRAIHLELVTDMTSEAFIAALKRFVARRGRPSSIYSDCGTTFIGASKELKLFSKLVKEEPFNRSVSSFLSGHSIQWHFNPPSAPHMGGLWEAGVKSLKYHLHRVVGPAILNFEELTTLLYQIEACLNSRPLCAATPDIESFDPLTPGHFLIGSSLTAVPEPTYHHLRENRLSRWQFVQRLLSHFWTRWSSEYLARLQSRPKWWFHQPNFEVGDLVILKDDRFPPQQWHLGRIIAVHPGEDSKVRVITVKTPTGIYKRPVSKLCALPLANEDED